MKVLTIITLLTLLFTLGYSEECQIQKGCPVKKTSKPICGSTEPELQQGNIYKVDLCATESPDVWGGSFDYDFLIYGTIKQIVTTENRDNYCSAPSGVGSQKFTTHCACHGGCLIQSSWTIFYETPGEQKFLE